MNGVLSFEGNNSHGSLLCSRKRKLGEGLGNLSSVPSSNQLCDIEPVCDSQATLYNTTPP